MAHVYPKEIPADVSATKSERALFEALRDGLPDDYHVYFAMPFITAQNADQGEVDFIILHPQRGMLFLECKGHGVERDHDGTWYRLKGKRREPLRQTPAEQAKKQVEALVTKFRDPCTRLFGGVKGRFPMAYGWALAFPFTRWTPNEVPPDAEPEVFLDAMVLTHTQTMIEAAFDFWTRKYDTVPRVTPAQFELFRKEVLSPEFKLVPNLGGALEIERQQMIRLSSEQAHLASMFIANKRIMVSGGAGTGKTLLALHCAQLLAAEGKRVLLLCFNRALGDHLRQTTEAINRDIELAHAETMQLRIDDLGATTQMARPDDKTTVIGVAAEPQTVALRADDLDAATTLFRRPDLALANPSEPLRPQTPGTIEATNFHRLCSRAAWALDQPFEDLDRNITSTTQFWVDQAPEVLWHALAEHKIGPWDAIIVDEGQDFAPSWWDILECGVEEGGHLAIFYDASQSLFEHGGRIPVLGPVMPLQHNYRNTRAISQVLKKFVDGQPESHPACASGEAPTIIAQTTPEKTRKKLAEIIQNMIDVHGLKYHQIAILTPRTPGNSVLEGTTNLFGIPIVHHVSERENGVFHTTISGFKGLESDVVFLLDIDPTHERCTRHARYVGASRACLRLYVFEKANWLS
ncbi:MAG: AAA family ATPase [bacterium]